MMQAGGGSAIFSTLLVRSPEVISLLATQKGKRTCRKVLRSFVWAKPGNGTHHFLSHSVGQNLAATSLGPRVFQGSVKMYKT